VLAIQDSIARGERGYDFLAGGGGHKSRVANREHAMKWIAIGRDSPERRIEAKLRGAKRMLRTIATNVPKRSCRSVFRIWGLVPRRSVWLFGEDQWEVGLSTVCDVTIVGAGLFGLSVAAHLRRPSVEHRTIGSPMESWKSKLPKGRLLGFSEEMTAAVEARSQSIRGAGSSLGQ
jgi:hypothetical protein